MPLPLSDVAIGIWSFSASCDELACACEVTTPPPATMIGFFAAASTLAASRTRSASGSGRNAGTRVNCCSTSGSTSSIAERHV